MFWVEDWGDKDRFYINDIVEKECWLDIKGKGLK